MGQNSANQKFDKGLTLKIHKELIQLSLKKQKKLSKMGKEPVLTFLKRSHQMATMYIKMCSTSLT